MKNANRLTVGEKIALFRKRAEISQAELEEFAQLGIGTINKIESGNNLPTRRTLHKIAITLKLDGKETAYLFDVNFYKDLHLDQDKNLVDP